MHQFDFLVIGGGIAGLTYALQAAEHGEVAVLFKKDLETSSTSWAQGGIAAVSSKEDDPQLHIQDTLSAGAGLCNKEIVSMVVHEGPKRIEDLIHLGVQFDLLEDNSTYHLNLEGGHSRRRIYHAADSTGYEIQRTLLRKARENKKIVFFQNATAIDLITTYKLGQSGMHDNLVLGAYVYLDSPEKKDSPVEIFLAQKVLVATGGAGKIYLYTSNPDIATGDGIAMCYRAGVEVANMEFFQFHPTCLYHPEAKSFLLSEAIRGEGGILTTKSGERFMHKYDPRGELAPRDIVARAIDNEIKHSGENFVYLNISHKSSDFILKKFPTIYERCLAFGFDITKQPVPVVPAAHFCCGGVVSDSSGRTSIKNLYVAGECAYTGLHGANRLASNSLLEGLVFGHRAAQDSLSTFDKKQQSPIVIPEWNTGSAIANDELVLISAAWDEIRTLMWNYVGIVRSIKRLERALKRISLIEHEIHNYYWNFYITSDLLELRNLSLVAKLVIDSAVLRKESRGLHFTVDFPQSSQEFQKETVLQIK
jgi:L-aspartate oxidase